MLLPDPATAPEGTIGAFLTVLGTQECGPEYSALAELAGGHGRRWSFGSATESVLTIFDTGIDVHIRDDQVQATRIWLRAEKDEPT